MINPPKASDVETVLYSLANLARHYWLHIFYYCKIAFLDLKILGKNNFHRKLIILNYGKGSYLTMVALYLLLYELSRVHDVKSGAIYLGYHMSVLSTCGMIFIQLILAFVSIPISYHSGFQSSLF